MSIHRSTSAGSTAQPSPALRVSLYRSFKDSSPTKDVHLSEIATMITDPGSNLKPATEKCRVAYRAAENAGRPRKKDPVYDAAKKALPAFIMTGVCAGNKKEQMVSHSGLIQIDLDGLTPEAVEEAMTKLTSDPRVALAFRSPSGAGVKAALRVELPATPLIGVTAIEVFHKAAYEAGAAYVRDTHGLEPDEGSKGLRQMCFLAHDPAAHVNLEATPLPVGDYRATASADEAKPFTRRSAADRKAFAAWAKRRSIMNLKCLDLPGLLRELGWYIKEATVGTTQKVFFRCPWEHEHTTANSDRDMAAIRSIDLTSAIEWGIRCVHGHCADRGLRDVLEAAEQEEPGIVNQFCGVDATPAELDRRRNDVFNADVFVRLHGDKVRFLHDERNWMVWNGTYWKADAEGAALRLAKTVADELWKMDDDPKWRTHAVNSGNARRMDDMLKVAACDERVAAMRADFDRDPFLLGCPNGTVDLRTGILRPSNPKDMISKQAAVPYDRNAKCPNFEKFMADIFADRPGMVSFMGRALGYCLTGDVSEQKFFFFHGRGANGKSTLVNQLHRVMGDYGQKAPVSLFTTSSKGQDPSRATPEVVALAGVRLAYASEPEAGDSLAEARLKDLVSGETITGRSMYSAYSSFKPVAKLILSGNHKPKVKGTDHGIWRRVLMISFNQCFDGERRDPDLDEKLKAEAPGLLAWLVRGAMEWLKHGLMVPPCVLADTAEYRDGEDIILMFLRECTEDIQNAGVERGQLYAAYSNWCQRSGIKHPITKPRFNETLRDRGYREERHHGGHRWARLGIRLVLPSLGA